MGRGRGPAEWAGADDVRTALAYAREGTLTAPASFRSDPATDRQVLVRVEGVVKHFPIRSGLLRRVVGRVHAVDGVSLEVRRGETLGIGGATAGGQSTLARCI